MRFHLTPTFVLAIWSCLSMAAAANGSQFNEQISVGAQAPGFSNLPGIDGNEHGLGDYKSAKAVVVVFTSNKCPVAVAYDERLVALQKEYAERGVQLVAICTNFEAGHELEALQEHATANGFNFPVVRDDTQAVGRAYGATHTPQVFVLDGDRRIAYMGAIDDSEDPTQVKKPYLREALDSLLAGQSPATTDTQPFGCRIRYKRQR